MKKIVLLAVIQSLIFSAPLYAWELPWEKNKRESQERVNQIFEQMNSEQKEKRIAISDLISPCENEIRGISRIPATLQISLITGRNRSNYTKTEGGYVIDLDVTDSDGSYNINCYLDDGKRVIDLQKHY